MQRYKKLDLDKNFEYLKSIKNLFFKPPYNKNFFVEPWNNKLPRVRSKFNEGRLFFCTGDKSLMEMFVDNRGHIHLYGAYNYMTVVQIKAYGTVEPAKSVSEIAKAREVMQLNLEGFDLVSLLHAKEGYDLDEEKRIIDTGKMFIFTPKSLFYKYYERG